MNSNEHIWNVTGGVDEGIFEFIWLSAEGMSTKKEWEPLLYIAG